MALGPFFDEQETFEQHKPHRDYLATLECKTSDYLKSLNKTVLGVHYVGAEVDESVISTIRKKLIFS